MAKTKQPSIPSPAAPARGPVRRACKVALGCFVSGIVGGVTEPALYGLGLRYRRPLIGLAVGGFVGGVWAGATHVTAYIMGSSSFLSILGYVGGGVLNTVNAGISDLLAMGIAAAITYPTWRDGNASSRG